MSNRSFLSAAIASLALVLAAVAVVVVFSPADTSDAAPAQASTSATVTTTTRASSSTSTRLSTPTATPTPQSFQSAATFYDMTTGKTVGTSGQHEPWPALSLAKLYIADYVLDHGSVDEGFAALEMVSTSDDRIAGELYRAYPKSIDRVAAAYDLEATHGAQRWGHSTTSTHDVVTFLAALYEKDPYHPILAAMSLATPQGADGYPQDYGTFVLPGELGTKWGWSDDRDMHVSASIGQGWIGAAATIGSAQELTRFSRAQLEDRAEKAVKAN